MRVPNYILLVIGLSVLFLVIGLLLGIVYDRRKAHSVLARNHKEIKYLKKENERLSEANGVYISRIKGAQMALAGGNH